MISKITNLNWVKWFVVDFLSIRVIGDKFEVLNNYFLGGKKKVIFEVKNMINQRINEEEIVYNLYPLAINSASEIDLMDFFNFFSRSRTQRQHILNFDWFFSWIFLNFWLI